jgi:hypothetical protein
LDVTVGGESRTPTGCVIICGYATSLNNNGNHNQISFGVSDFTDTYSIAYSDENNVDPTDSITHHQTGDIISIHTPGTSSVSRTCSVTAISGGIQLTPGESGSQRQFIAIIIFGSACKAFSDGDGTTQDSTFQVAHGFSTAPGVGFYGLSTELDSSSADAQNGWGFHAYNGAVIEQASWGIGCDNAVGSVSDINSWNHTSRVAIVPTMVDTEDFGADLTAIDGTNCTYTSRTGTLDGDLIGLLVECDDCEAEIVVVDSPTDPDVDWNFNGLSWEPQFAAMLISRHTDVDDGKDDSNAGSFGYFVIDTDGAEYTVGSTSLDNRNISTSQSFTRHRTSNGLHLMTQGGVDAHDMDTFVLTSDGWDVADAAIDDADAVGRKWHLLAIQPSSGIGLPGFHAANRGILRGANRGIL